MWELSTQNSECDHKSVFFFITSLSNYTPANLILKFPVQIVGNVIANADHVLKLLTYMMLHTLKTHKHQIPSS